MPAGMRGSASGDRYLGVRVLRMGRVSSALTPNDYDVRSEGLFSDTGGNKVGVGFVLEKM